jgi:hypothetical protein
MHRCFFDSSLAIPVTGQLQKPCRRLVTEAADLAHAPPSTNDHLAATSSPRYFDYCESILHFPYASANIHDPQRLPLFTPIYEGGQAY